MADDTREYVFENENPHDEVSSERPMRVYLWLQSVIESVLAAFLIMALIFRINVVVGESMEPTLYENDRIVVSQFFYTPKYGDIVALWAKDLTDRGTGERGEMIVKRVIGLPGDIIDIDKNGVVYRNGEPLYEEYAAEPILPSRRGNAEFPLTVDENCVFVLGDNRNHSTDSRYVNDGIAEFYVGCVDMRYVVGKALFRIFPFDRIGAL